jgi:Protein of unknown function (DUF935)
MASNLNIQNRLKLAAAAVKKIFVPQQLMQTGSLFAGQYTPHFIPPTPNNISSYIAPVQFQRQRPDIQTWRDAVSEAENAWYPHRIKMQRLYIDTILNGHVSACMAQRNSLTMLRGYKLFKNGVEQDEEFARDLLQHQWFFDYVQYTLEAKAFGYSLIQIGDIENGRVSNVKQVRRWNVSPDRYNVTTLVYSLSGQPFLEEPFSQWCTWIPTTTDIAVSNTGYGYLYKVAPYEIMLRNILGFNGDYIELFAAPFRWLKTTKTEDIERQQLAAMLQQMGSTGWGIGDIDDQLEFINANGSGSGWQGYENFEKRCEAKISKIILGHADALDSTAGKLGNDSEDSPAQKALEAIQSVDGKFVEATLNTTLFPKLAALGLAEFEGLTLEYTNDDEAALQREREDKANQITAQVLLTLKNAGFSISPEYVSERMGIDLKNVEQTIVPTADSINVSKDVMNSLHELYNHKH